jgi:para-nitrobenzyl esterase
VLTRLNHFAPAIPGDPMNRSKVTCCPRLSILIVSAVVTSGLLAGSPVHTDAGDVEGTAATDSSIRTFLGIPYAAPPVGELRWKPPQPAAHWTGVRKAAEFGSRCMQGHIFGDMVFRDQGISEDCLYLNVWTPATSSNAHLPVMVWIYGGGFAAGAASEPRQDGTNLAKKGVVVVSFNYRLGVFGFFSHSELAKESGHRASGNYGLLDQVAALQWVRRNVAQFGGDPHKVTIFGESAGSFSVSALMASPLSKSLFQRAIGESGAFFGDTLSLKPLARSEEADMKFAESIGAGSLDALRAKPATELLEAALNASKQNTVRFAPNIDGYFLPEDAYTIYSKGKQSHLPLLAGWNADEGSYRAIFEKDAPTAHNLVAHARTLFGDKADDFLKVYSSSTDEEAKRSAQDLAGDQFIGYSTWKWIEIQRATGGSPVFRYRFEQAPPMANDANPASADRGAYHSAEIEFVFGTLDSKHLPWRDEDRKVSDLMSSYWANFAKAGDPNGPGLPEWPPYGPKRGYQVMHLSATPHATPDQHRGRYQFLDSVKTHTQATEN